MVHLEIRNNLLSVAKPLPQEISRTTLKSLHFSQKVAKYEKKVNTGKFGKGKGKYTYARTLQIMTV